MNEDQPHKQSLTVLPHSGKVEQLKEEAAQAAAANAASTDLGGGLPSFRTATDPGHAAPPNPDLTPEQRALEQKVIDVLRSVYDPEIPVNIYELGLIYGVTINPDNSVSVRMTLTAPACPVAGTLPGEVETKIQTIPEVTSATVELVWDPPWQREMMSEAAQLQLGLL